MIINIKEWLSNLKVNDLVVLSDGRPLTIKRVVEASKTWVRLKSKGYQYYKKDGAISKKRGLALHILPVTKTRIEMIVLRKTIDQIDTQFCRMNFKLRDFDDHTKKKRMKSALMKIKSHLDTIEKLIG